MMLLFAVFLGCAWFFAHKILSLSQSPGRNSASKPQTSNLSPKQGLKTFKDSNRHHVTISNRYKRVVLSQTNSLLFLPGGILAECTGGIAASGFHILDIKEHYQEVHSLSTDGLLHSHEDGRGCFLLLDSSHTAKQPKLLMLESSRSVMYKTTMLEQTRNPKYLLAPVREDFALPKELGDPVCGISSGPVDSHHKVFIFHRRENENYTVLSEIDLLSKKTGVRVLRSVDSFRNASTSKQTQLNVTGLAWLGRLLLLCTSQDHKLVLLDPKSMKLVDQIDLSEVATDYKQHQESQGRSQHPHSRTEYFTAVSVNPTTGEIYVTGSKWEYIYRLRVLGFGNQ